MSRILNMISGFLTAVGSFALASVLPAVILLAAGILAITLLMKIITTALEKSELEKSVSKLIVSLVRIALYVLLGLIVASRLGIDVTGIVALASVLTLAVSLAIQNALTNIIGGFTLLHTKPFAVGDYVEIAGQSGTVREIGLNYTKMTTPDNRTISIPNSAVTSAQIINYSVAGTRRAEIEVSASYDAPVEKVLEALREAAQLPTVLESPGVNCIVKNYGDSAIVYSLYLWTKSSDNWSTKCEVTRRIKEIFDAKGIEMTYPHLNVHLDK